MKRFLRWGCALCIVAAVTALYDVALSANSVTVPSASLDPGQTGVVIPIHIVNDVTLRTVVAPLIIRSTIGGAFITSVKLGYGDRLPPGAGQPLAEIVINNLFLTEDGNCLDGQPGGFGTIAFTDTMPHPVAASPLGAIFARFNVLGPALPPGADVTGSMRFTVDVGNVPGAFEIDTTCTDPGNHLLFIDTGDNSFTPSFTRGVFTVGNPPVARDTAWSTPEDTPRNVTYLPAHDVDGDPLTFAIAAGPFNGNVTGFNVNTGAFTYTPNPDYSGPDSIRFQADDGLFLSNVATVRITVSPVNDPPVARDTSVTTNEDTPVNARFQGYDIDSPNLTYIRLTGPFHGTFVGFNPAAGTFTYTPASNYSGPDSITFRISDGFLNSNVAVVRITVISVNDPPVARDSNLTTPADSPVQGQFHSYDPDGGPPTYAITGGPFNGAVSDFNPSTGSFTYTPNTGYVGPDSIKFTAHDGFDLSNVGTIRINVTPSDCICACWADPKCNGAHNAVDLNIVINVVFFGMIPPASPHCPRSDVDVNCDCLESAIDVAVYVNRVYFGGVFSCDPCATLCFE